MRTATKPVLARGDHHHVGRPSPLWNTRYTDAAVTALRAAGRGVRDEDAARLSPLGHAHINMLGRYAFTPPAAGAGLRPLREPDRLERE